MVILFLVFFVVAMLSATVKFGLLNDSFWKTSFAKNNVYAALSEALKNSLTNQVGKEGGNKTDVSILTDLITEDNTKDFVNNNLTNFIDYLNGKSQELIVYIPLNRAPKGLLPKNIAALNNELTIKQLAEKFNVTGLDHLSLQNLSTIGVVVSYTFIGSLVLLAILIIFLIWIVESGKRFTAVGLAIILCGLLTLILAQFVAYLIVYISQNFAGADIARIIVAVSAPPLLAEMVNWWTYLGVVLIVAGALAVLVKKPGNENR